QTLTLPSWPRTWAASVFACTIPARFKAPSIKLRPPASRQWWTWCLTSTASRRVPGRHPSFRWRDPLFSAIPLKAGAGLARLWLWARRHTSTAQRLGLCEDQTTAEGNRAFDEEQRLKPFKRRREIRATQKPRGVVRPHRNRQVPPAC